jgi:hypothetical protein
MKSTYFYQRNINTENLEVQKQRHLKSQSTKTSTVIIFGFLLFHTFLNKKGKQKSYS